MVNVTRPSTSAGSSPASASAASVASAASRSSLRPESLENSVAPIPAIAAVPEITACPAFPAPAPYSPHPRALLSPPPPSAPAPSPRPPPPRSPPPPPSPPPPLPAPPSPTPLRARPLSAPAPALLAPPPRFAPAPSLRQAEPDRARHVVAEAAPADDLDHAVLPAVLAFPGLDHPPGDGQRVPRVAGHAEPDVDLADQRVRASPVGDVPLHQAGGGEDVDEDVLAAARRGLVPVVVHVLEVPGRDRRGDHERGRDVDHEFRQNGAGGHGHGRSSRQAGSVRSLSIFTNSARTGMPTRTWSGSTPSSSPTIRTPSVSWTSATTNGAWWPGTGGW